MRQTVCESSKYDSQYQNALSKLLWRAKYLHKNAKQKRICSFLVEAKAVTNFFSIRDRGHFFTVPQTNRQTTTWCRQLERSKGLYWITVSEISAPAQLLEDCREVKVWETKLTGLLVIRKQREMWTEEERPGQITLLWGYVPSSPPLPVRPRLPQFLLFLII